MRKRTKRKPPSRTLVVFPQNHAYWEPIRDSVQAVYPHIAAARTSQDYLTDRMADTIITPPSEALERFDKGEADFDHYWYCLQSLYLLAHVVFAACDKWQYHYVDTQGKRRPELQNQAVELFTAPLRQVQTRCETAYRDALGHIGARHKRTGKYGLTGEDRAALQMMLQDLDDMTTWASVGMLTFAIDRCLENLTRVERSISKSRGWT